jgi:hypothetical protein
MSTLAPSLRLTDQVVARAGQNDRYRYSVTL